MQKNKFLTVTLLLVLVLCIGILQLFKRQSQIESIKQRLELIEESGSPYAKLINQLPIYRDSIYSVYVTKILLEDKIVFLKKGSISKKQKESSFFVHLYPKDKSKLKEGTSHIPKNFKNNMTSFLYENEVYFVSKTKLPSIKISKLNLGQYGFRGDNSISWKIPELLTEEKIGKILKENKEDVQLFDLIGDSF